MGDIEAFVKGGLIIPVTPVEKFEGKRIILRVIKEEEVDPEKKYSYVKLLKEGVDAEEYFEI